MLPCKGEIVDGWPWELDPSKVELRKVDPQNSITHRGVRWLSW
jgi:hypothetical protein